MRTETLPMVAVDKDYTFAGPDRTVSLLDLFADDTHEASPDFA